MFCEQVEIQSANVMSLLGVACLTLPEILNMMPSLNPPIGALLEVTNTTCVFAFVDDALAQLMPRLAPRFYSISSAPTAHGTRIHVTAVVVGFQRG